MKLNVDSIRELTRECTSEIEESYKAALSLFSGKIVVLDDDPTGIQTVHDVSVYTDWKLDSIREGFTSPDRMFFILTNSRGLSVAETTKIHSEIAGNLLQVAAETKQRFLLISRSDSTLRGHYPLETKVLQERLEQGDYGPIDGEIIMPFFPEGGRYTIDDVHYVMTSDTLIPAGETEFAKDRTFGYAASDLKEWLQEKTKGQYKAQSVISIPLSLLKEAKVVEITTLLKKAENFQKIIVNAVDYTDVKVFVTALMQAIAAGKNFLFRCAAALTKVIGGISDKELLSHEELVDCSNKNGGLIVIGSHVKKTTDQMLRLQEEKDLTFLEFDVTKVNDEEAFAEERKRVLDETETNIARGKTTVVYTTRKRIDIGENRQEEELLQSVKISNAVSDIVHSLSSRPNFIIAKGGITSSDVGTKGLMVRRATVLGQILKGIPVWLTGQESKFPNMRYVIFPGNVGNDNALREAYNKIKNDQ